MILTSYSYSELAGTPREWRANLFALGDINLFVGKNGSGKSRLLNTLHALSIFVGQSGTKLNSGTWECRFSDGQDHFELTVAVENNNKITSENFRKNFDTLLWRNEKGEGEIWNSELNKPLKFKIPTELLAIHSKRDELQHPFLEPLFRWAKSVKKYDFGTDFGKHFALPVNMIGSEGIIPQLQNLGPKNVTETYMDGLKKFQNNFDAAILKDFKKIGYACESITARPFNQQDFGSGFFLPSGQNQIPIVLEVKEVDLPGPTRQFDMSMGMYRALAIIVYLNYALMTKERGTIIIDDIGEGLDFDRARSLAKLLIKKCQASKISLIMATNDRFIMNEIDLTYWHIINRTKNVLNIFDYTNSKKRFDDFRFLGLSNFDLFSKEILSKAG